MKKEGKFDKIIITLIITGIVFTFLNTNTILNEIEEIKKSRF